MALKSSQNAPKTSPDGPQASQNLKKTVLLVVLGTSENHLDALLGPGLSFSAIFSQNGAKKLPKCSQSLPFALFVLPFSLHFLSKRPPHPQTRHAPMSADPLTLLTPRATDPQTHRPLRPTDHADPQTHRHTDSRPPDQREGSAECAERLNKKEPPGSQRRLGLSYHWGRGCNYRLLSEEFLRILYRHLTV